MSMRRFLALAVLLLLCVTGVADISAELKGPGETLRLGNVSAQLKVPEECDFASGSDADAIARKYGDGIKSGGYGFIFNHGAADSGDFAMVGELMLYCDSHIVSAKMPDEKMLTDHFNESISKVTESFPDAQLMWEPEYNYDRGTATVGISYKGPDFEESGERTCRAFVFVPGKEICLVWVIQFTQDSYGKVVDVCRSLLSGIDFVEGERYDDFVYYGRKNATMQNYLCMLNGIYNNDHPEGKSPVASLEEKNEKGKGGNVFNRAAEKGWDMVKFFGMGKTAVVFAVLFGILIILLLPAVGIMIANRVGSRKAADTDMKYMRRASRNLMARIWAYLIAYIALISLSLMSVVALFYATLFFVVAMFSGWIVFVLGFGITGVLILVSVGIFIGGIWAMALMCLWVVAAPLFKFGRRTADNGIEVDDTTAPELLALVRETAEETGVEKPLHVYITTQVNASAGYDNPLRSVVWPTRLNLSIGAPLFILLSRQEIKAVVAHEFGHFAQPVLRQSITAWYACSFINRILDDDQVNNPLLNKWRVSNNHLWRGWGNSTYNMIVRIRRGVYSLFRFVMKVNNEMNRCMEIDADKTSARVAGSRYAVSAHYKVMLTDRIIQSYVSLLENIYRKGKNLPGNAYGCLKRLLPLLQSDRKTDYADLVSENPDNGFKSRIEQHSMWETHPDSALRVAAMRSADVAGGRSGQDVIPEPAESLLTSVIWDKAGLKLLENADPMRIDSSDDEFLEVAEKEYKDRTLPQDLVPFFGRSLHINSSDLLVGPEMMDEAGMESGKRLSEEFETACHDWNTLGAFVNGQLDFNRIMYLGRPYGIKNAPLDIHRSYLDSLEKRMHEFDRRMFAHALTFDSEENIIRNAYNDIVYAQGNLNNIHRQLEAGIRWIVDFYNTPVVVDPAPAEAIVNDMEKMERNFKTICAREKVLKRLEPVIHTELREWLDGYMKRQTGIYTLDNVEYVRGFINAYRYVLDLLNDLCYFSVKKVVAVMKGEDPEMCWKGSVASVEAKAPVTDDNE